MKYAQTPIHGKTSYDNYDCIVIGSGMGGLSVSALLSKEGMRVLLLERHVRLGGLTQTFSRGPFSWSVGLHYVGEVMKKGVIRLLFDHVSDGALEWSPLPDVFNKIVVGKETFDQIRGREAWRQSVLKRFPEEKAAVDGYLDLIDRINDLGKPFLFDKAAPGPTTNNAIETYKSFARKTTYEVLSGLTRNKMLIAYLCGHYGDYGLPPRQSSFAIHAGVAKHYEDGAGYPIGGSGRIVETIVPVITGSGGKVVRGAAVAEVLVKNQRVEGVKLSDGAIIKAPVVVSAAGLHTTRKLLGNNWQASELINDTNTPCSISHIGLYLGLDADHERLGISGANIWAHPGPDLDDNAERYANNPDAPFPWSFITFPSAKDPHSEISSPGKSTIEVTVPAHFEHFAAFRDTVYPKRNAEYQKLKVRLAERLTAEVSRFVPSLERYIRHAEVSTPLTTLHFTGHRKGHILGIANEPGRFSHDWLRAATHIRGFFLSGQDLISDGVSTALLSGALTASAVLEYNVINRVFEQNQKQKYFGERDRKLEARA